ncbi:MAG TPA: NAD(P)-binding domain-containing protein [Hyphomicrobiaceae bacterium]|nr:NAD(P)-binding domain-containing protein [Hyphomicrobiaceae bacterium]
MRDATRDRYVIIGAGASGLATAKTFLERGIAFDCLEREPDIGGLWNIATASGIVYETTHLVSSISSTGFDDLPMLDEDYPEYPRHDRVLSYFRDYAGKFGLLSHIELGKAVCRLEPQPDHHWQVSVAGEAEPRSYRGVIIASGHHDVPRLPSYPGSFAGEILHSRRYKSPLQVRDKRVLVVGCGNSAADVVADAVHGRSQVFLSLRRGYWFVPKFVLGFPTGDVLANVEMVPLPRRVKRWLFQASLWLLQGPPSRYRMPQPDYAIDQAHPTMSDEIPRLVAHGSLTLKPEISGYDGARVLFTDGSAETVDLIVFATGYQPVLPFLDPSIAFGHDGQPRFAYSVFHPDYPNLFAVGLVQANGSMWRLADYQAQTIATSIIAEARAPERAARFRSRLWRERRRQDFVGSERHRLEVNYYDYRRTLQRLNRSFGPVRHLRFEASPGTPSAAAAALPAPQSAPARCDP